MLCVFFFSPHRYIKSLFRYICQSILSIVFDQCSSAGGFPLDSPPSDGKIPTLPQAGRFCVGNSEDESVERETVRRCYLSGDFLVVFAFARKPIVLAFGGCSIKLLRAIIISFTRLSFFSMYSIRTPCSVKTKGTMTANFVNHILNDAMHVFTSCHNIAISEHFTRKAAVIFILIGDGYHFPLCEKSRRFRYFLMFSFSVSFSAFPSASVCSIRFTSSLGIY